MDPRLYAGKNKISLLKEAFNSFEEAAGSLKNYYLALERKVRSLDIELRRKNKELAKNLRDTQNVRTFLQGILDNLTICILRVDRYGIIRGANKAAEALMGLKQEALIGKKAKAALAQFISGDTSHELSTMRICRFSELEVKIKRADGENGVFLMTLSPVKGRTGASDGCIIMLQDISLMRKLEEQAERSRRLLAMAEMAQHFAHAVRNPLGSIELLSSLLMRELSSQESKAKLVAKLLASVKNLNQFVSNLLIFTTAPRPNFKPVWLGQCLQEAVHFAMPIAEQSLIKMRIDKLPMSLAVRGDAELLKQVFLNIIFNAIQAMPTGGEVAISATTGRSEIGRARRPRAAKASGMFNGLCEITFADTGIGISEDIRNKIFNPFFTTRANGLGLGLATADNIIKAHGGYLDLESKPGRGSVFRVKLPLARFETGRPKRPGGF